MGRPGGGTNFEAAFEAAFSLLRGEGGNGCQKMILFLTDGEDTSGLSLDRFSETSWNAAKDVTIFSYIIGGDTESLVEKPAQIACGNAGKYFVITDLAQIRDTMADYFRFFADADGPDTVRWLSYSDAITGTELVSGCLSIYKGQEVFGVACMDINVIVTLPELRGKATYDAFVTKMEQLSTLCRPLSLTDEELTRLRGASTCGSYSAATAAQPMSLLLLSLLSFAVAWYQDGRV
mmetsp:Transcript_17706/g.36289  ORF Transcript_17706/g.36289 Transcript_17706/m.36289 type:complete len:235 (+) Transcript_17706:282-986(+)